MAKFKQTGKRAIVDGEMQISGSASGEVKHWNNFSVSVVGYDDKKDRQINHRIDFDRKEAKRILNYLAAMLTEEIDHNKPRPQGKATVDFTVTYPGKPGKVYNTDELPD